MNHTKMNIIFNIFLVYILESFVGHSDAFCKDVIEKLERAKLTFETGYYWRDYYGDIPCDAFPGGTDVNGNPVYIGQNLGKFLIPGKIYSSSKKYFYEWGHKEYETTHQVKILCTRNPEQLKWIQTDNEGIKSLAHENLILGGTEPNWTTYIGRTYYNGEVLVGKVLVGHSPNYAGLWTTSNGKSKRFTSFEVLSSDRSFPIIQYIYRCITGSLKVFHILCNCFKQLVCNLNQLFLSCEL